jgi:CheY-like chemotaxis protein
MATERLLLVDDDPDNLTVLAVTLSEKYTVLSCGSAAEALFSVQGFKPDLLVLDVGMSPINGLQCLNVIRGMADYANIPAIALTAYAHEADKLSFIAAGFQAVVTKPLIEPRILEAVINRLLSKSHTATRVG